MLRGLSTVSFYADDVTAAARWYAGLLGVEPYFTRSVEGTLAYAEFRIGDQEDELGVVDSRFAPRPRPDEPGGAVVYWHVDDVEAAVGRLLALGATTYEKPVERGPGFVTASVVDPFGNVLGVMYNRHFLEVSGR
ncbi:VOC family protein [Microbispora triticiradicis]|uniref:VOC family protein n=1 Tax=Microbispora triticiradicis TaxID=2200763 RepID=UPI001AD6563B|nr:VOC family protein [Microbispora triticiradicis]MBO4272577.1 VOC family protein [Microbispora triticiradicis]